MDKKLQLQKVQFKLTIIFTLLVFLIAWVLQMSFFSYKYYSGVYQETKKINFISDTIHQKQIPLHKLTGLIKNEKKLWEQLSRDENMPLQWKIMNYAILDSYNNVLIENIRWDINIEAVSKALADKNTKIHIKDNTIIKYSSIERSIETYQLLLFKELDYDIDTYLNDIIRFFIAIGLFSILFLFIWYIFVKKNLKPVEDNIIEMNDFVHNAWHELKTPISVIHSNLQLMKHLGEYKEDMLLENLNEISRLNNLIEALVTITDIQENGHTEKNNIKEELDYILEEFKTDIQNKNITIKHIQNKNFTIQSDKEYLYIFLSNIIKNAVKFSDKWGIINISYMENICIIQDYWIWIDKQNMNKIFNRFFQEEQSRNSQWFGIWLALVSKIAKIYKWKIQIESKKWEGTKFIINFK